MCGIEQTRDERQNDARTAGEPVHAAVPHAGVGGGTGEGGGAGGIEIEFVDNWHRRWDEVLAQIARDGVRHNLMIDAHGWLSARQVVVAAFAGGAVAGHVAFRIQLGPEGCVEARLDSFGTATAPGDGLTSGRLADTALARARELKCGRLIGFDELSGLAVGRSQVD